MSALYKKTQRRKKFCNYIAYNIITANAAIAQLVERIHGKDEVTGSIPVRGSICNLWPLPLAMPFKACLRSRVQFPFVAPLKSVEPITTRSEIYSLLRFNSRSWLHYYYRICFNRIIFILYKYTQLVNMLPSLSAINDALDFQPEKVGLEIGKQESYAHYRVVEPGQLATAPKEWRVPSVSELVNMRIAALEGILQRWGINLETDDIHELRWRIAKNSHDILLAVREDAPVWQWRFNTRTMTLRAWDGEDALIVDVEQDTFRDIWLVGNYWALRDGGVKLRKKKIPGNVVGQIGGEVYKSPLVAGGDKNLSQLYNHPVIQALIPDETTRWKYLAALWILNSLGFFKTGSNSIWVPDKLPPWFFRWHALGFEADAFYPPNLWTKRFELFMTPEEKQ